jgi:serine/threonine-protein kinase
MSPELELIAAKATLNAQLQDTLLASDGADALSVEHKSTRSDTTTTAGRTTMTARTMTVLPRTASAVNPTPTQKPRYQSEKVLGEGGMGEVVLADDHDIDRRVAIKRLHAEVAMSGPALMRFADEVRIAGALQHPNIVPVYDVGIDAAGQHYFVMKYLEGETLETVIDKLRANDRAYIDKYTYSYRVTMCIEILKALEYAHAHGILHRDLKPANIMIGPHGEVTLTDWGIAKRIKPRPVDEPVCEVGRPKAPEMPMRVEKIIPALLGLTKVPKGGKDAPRIDQSDPPKPEQSERTAHSPKLTGTDDRPHATRAGALLGTPMYMSPEQAAGKIDELDERSDLFSASVLFGEFLSLRHYLADRTTLSDVLDGVLHEDFHFRYGLELGLAGMPAEMFHVVLKGLWREPDKRWQSAREMAAAFARTLSGDIWVCCPFTLTRRTVFVTTTWVNTHPRAVTFIAVTTPLILLGLVLLGIVAIVARLH